jgi:hypothetical protein
MATPLPLDLIVDVTTTVVASSPGTAAFDVTMLFDGENVLNTGPGTNPIVPVIREYSSLAEMVADGFKTYNYAYRSVQALFAQADRPDSVKVAGIPSGMDIQDFASAVEDADPAWYGLLLDWAADDVTAGFTTSIQDAAEWCLSIATGKHCLFFDSSRDIDKTTSANLFSGLADDENDRASGFWHESVAGAYTLTFSEAFVASNSTTGKVNGETFTVAYNTDNDTTLGDVATALIALNSVSIAIVLDAGTAQANRSIVLFANAGNNRLVLADLAVTGGTTQPTGTFGLAGQTFKLLTFSAALAASDVVSASINGTAISPVTFSVDNDTTVAAVATALAGISGVGFASVVPAGSNDRSILLASLEASARLDLTAGGVAHGGSGTATIAYTDYQTQPDYSVSASIVGECIAASPGTKAWSNRLLTLVGADALSTTEYNAILANSANVYAAFSQQKKATRIGTTASGLTIRNRILVDALDLAIQNAVFEALQNATLVPYTDAGIQSIVSVVNGVGQSFVSSGALASFTAAGPKRSAVSAGDVTAGVLNNVTYAAVSAGEIQKVNITGTVIV